jgi:LPXTG-motif cell wall-anchored protein
MGRQDEWQELEIPPEFLDFPSRHGMLPIYSLWGINLIFGSGALFSAILFASSRDFGADFFSFLAAALVLLTASLVFYLRKRRKNAERWAAFQRWRAEQAGSVGNPNEGS